MMTPIPPPPILLLAMEGGPRLLPARARIRAGFGRDDILIKGVDAHAADMFERCFPVTPHARANMSRGEVACASGHAAALIAFLATAAPWGIILEDDFEFLPGVAGPEVLHRIAKFTRLQPDWDLLQLVDHSASNEEVRPAGFPAEPVLGFTRCDLCVWQTVAYAVSRRGAAWMLGHLAPIWTQVDALLRHAGCHGRELWQADPPLFTQTRGPSLIHRPLPASIAPDAPTGRMDT